MNRVKQITGVVTVMTLALFLLAADVSAQGRMGMDDNMLAYRDRGAGDRGPGFRGERHGRRFGKHRGGKHCLLFGSRERMKEVLKLNESQLNKIETINHRFHKRHLELREKLAPLKIRLRRILLNDAVNLNKVRKQLRRISNVKIELRILRIKHRLEIEKVLTPKQKRILRSEKMRGRKHKMHRRHRRHRGHDRF